MAAESPDPAATSSGIDPDVVRVLDIMKKAGRPSYDTLTPVEAREASKIGRKLVQPDPPELAEVKNFTIPGSAGDIRARLYRPTPQKPGTLQPGLVYYHGGGWVIGDLDSHDVLVRQLAARSGVTAISIDYRLAPEHRFPAAVEDAAASLRWIALNAQSLGLDPSRLAVGGDSAGGNLATVAAILARDAGGPAIAFQLLIYPSTDLSMTQFSHEEHAEQPPLTKAVMEWFRQHYLGSADGWTDWRASPLSTPNLKNLPPAWVLTAGFDVLVDEGRDYVDRLRVSGVSVEHRHFPGQIHAFITMGRMIAEANTAVAEAAAALRAGLNAAAAPPSPRAAG